MSVVIVGGNECMTRQYKELCREYGCKAKVYPKMTTGLKDLGSPDLTSTISHKMVQCALKGNDARIARSHSSSIAALRSLLNEHAV